MSASKTSVFVLGDSISIGYGSHLDHFLGDSFVYDRKRDAEPGIPDDLNGENGEDSRKVLGYLRFCLERGDFTPDLLILNCGLHDLRHDAKTGAYQVALDHYAQNLRAIVELLGGYERRAVWVCTTPVDDVRHNTHQAEFQRFNADVERYNARADQIMSAAGIPIVDLYHFVQQIRKKRAEVFVDHVHYLPEIEQLQGAYMAGCVAIC